MAANFFTKRLFTSKQTPSAGWNSDQRLEPSFDIPKAVGTEVGIRQCQTSVSTMREPTFGNPVQNSNCTNFDDLVTGSAGEHSIKDDLSNDCSGGDDTLSDTSRRFQALMEKYNVNGRAPANNGVNNDAANVQSLRVEEDAGNAVPSHGCSRQISSVNPQEAAFIQEAVNANVHSYQMHDTRQAAVADSFSAAHSIPSTSLQEPSNVSVTSFDNEAIFSTDAPRKPMFSSQHGVDEAMTQRLNLRQTDSQGQERGVFVERHKVQGGSQKKHRLDLMPIFTFLGILGTLSLGGAGAYAAFFISSDVQEIPRVEHDLSQEKVIPDSTQRGGYQVPGLDLQVLERDLGVIDRLAKTNVAPKPEQPALDSVLLVSPSDGTGINNLTQDDIEQTQSAVLDGLNTPMERPNVPKMERPNVPKSAILTMQTLETKNLLIKEIASSADDTLEKDDAVLQQLIQLSVDSGVSGPLTPGASMFVPSPDNPMVPEGGVPGIPIPSLVPATQVTSPWGLQIAALRSADGARRLWQNLQQANLRLLGDVGFKIETIQKNNQPLYRLQIGPFPSRATAIDICAEIQKAEGNIGCFPVTSGR